MQTDAPTLQPRAHVQLFAYDEACPYLSARTATLQGFLASSLSPEVYRGLLDHGFRRSGRFFYRPHCRGCNECIPLRVKAMDFLPSRSQRRCNKRNQDLTVQIDKPVLTEEKADLYVRYQREKHLRFDEKDMGALRDFLYNPVVDTLEFVYRDPAGRLVAVGICDMFADTLSSVYSYYAAGERRRGLGTYSALYELDYAKQQRLTYYYMGFLVRGCQAMRYKASYRPHQLLDSSGSWQSGDEVTD